MDHSESIVEEFVRNTVRKGLKEIGARALAGVGEPSPEEMEAIEKTSWGKSGREPTAVFAMSDADADMLASIRKSAGIDKADAVADEEEGIDDDVPSISSKEQKKQKRKNITKGVEGMTLDDIARLTGFAGPAGVKNMLYRIEDQVRYFLSLDLKWFHDLMERLAQAYIEDLIDAIGDNAGKTNVKGVEADDIEFLLDLSERPDDVLQLPQFRMWAHDFLLDLYKNKKGKPAPSTDRTFDKPKVNPDTPSKKAKDEPKKRGRPKKVTV